MNDLTAALLPLLGVGGVTGFAALLARAFFGALKATAEVGEEKNRTIARKEAEIARQDNEIESLQLQLLSALRDSQMKDIQLADLQAQITRMKGTAS
jgi:hypothetical protein